MNLASEKRPQFLYWLAFAAIIGAAIWFRFQSLGALPFWLDEGYSAYGAEKGFDFIFGVLPGYETHPPFYTALLHIWAQVAGNSVYAFRLFGVLVGMAALPIFWLAGREAGRATGRDPALVGLAAIALAAIVPAIVVATRVTRPYPLIALALVFGVWAALRVARGLREEGRIIWRPYATYLVSLALLFWLHNLGALYVAGLGLGFLILCGPITLVRRFPVAFFAGHAAVALVALPAFLILLDQAPTWAKSTWLGFNPDLLFDQLLLIYGLSGPAALLCALIVGGWAAAKGGRTPFALFVIAITPVILALLLTLTLMPLFLPRTLVGCSVPLIILLAIGASSSSILPRAAFGLLIVLATTQLITIQKFLPGENWYGATAFLKSHVRPGDVIYAYPNEGALPLHYALKEKGLSIPIRPIPEAVPSHDPTGRYPTGSRGVVSLPQYRLEQIANDAQSQRVPTIWLLRLGAEKYDPGDLFLKALLRTRHEVGRWHQEPVFFIGLARTPQPAPKP
jgi:mannosyltransferase